MKSSINPNAGAGVAEAIAAHLSNALDRPLPDDIVEKTKHHILDTFGAMISGSRLKPGLLAIRYLEGMGGGSQACVVGTSIRANAADAALCNGIMAHADETDDSHLAGRFHPGCAVVPATLATSETLGRSGRELLAATALGYDMGARFSMSLGYATPESGSHSTHCLGAVFGAAAGAIGLCRFSPEQAASAVSYAIQQASGIRYWQRDEEHVEKAFDFAGMGARNGVTAALLVRAGFSGVQDPFTGRHNFFTAFADDPRPEMLTEGLGEVQGIAAASIKKWCVGSPIQAALDSVEALLAEHQFQAADLARVVVELPDDRASLVDDRSMPDICVQHLVAIMLIDGGMSFASAHDYERMHDPQVLAVRNCLELKPSPELTRSKPARQAIVTIDLKDRRHVSHRTYAVHGTPENPMGRIDVAAKFHDLAAPVLGGGKAKQLAKAVWSLENLEDVRDLCPLLQN